MTTPSMSAAKFVQDTYDRMSETDFQDRIVSTALRFGWIAYHTYDSRRSAAGFPDLVLVHPDRPGTPIIIAELKTEKGRVRTEQRDWLWALEARSDVPPMVALWRPSDLPEIDALLIGGNESGQV